MNKEPKVGDIIKHIYCGQEFLAKVTHIDIDNDDLYYKVISDYTGFWKDWDESLDNLYHYIPHFHKDFIIIPGGNTPLWRLLNE